MGKTDGFWKKDTETKQWYFTEASPKNKASAKQRVRRQPPLQQTLQNPVTGKTQQWDFTEQSKIKQPTQTPTKPSTTKQPTQAPTKQPTTKPPFKPPQLAPRSTKKPQPKQPQPKHNKQTTITRPVPQIPKRKMMTEEMKEEEPSAISSAMSYVSPLSNGWVHMAMMLMTLFIMILSSIFIVFRA